MEYRAKVKVAESPLEFKIDNDDCIGHVVVLDGQDPEVPIAISPNLDTAKDIAAALNFTSSIPPRHFYSMDMSKIAHGIGLALENNISVLSAIILEYEDAKAPQCEALDNAKKQLSSLKEHLRTAKDIMSEEG